MSATAGEDEGDKAAPHGWRGILKAFSTPSAATLFFLGFGCGLVLPLVGYIASTRMRDVGMELGLIGLVSYLTFFYTFKFVWTPLLDRFDSPLLGFLGHRRGWLVLSQVVLVLSLAGMAVFGPEVAFPLFLVCIGVAALAGATQDAMVDAYRIEIAPQSAQAALAATYTLGYRFALMAAGAGVLYLAEFWTWRDAYLVMAGLMLLPLGAALVAREPDQLHSRPQRTLLESFIDPFVEFFRRNGWVLALALLAFVGLYKLPDQMLGVIAGPFYLDTGFTKADIATVSKLYGIWIGIGGAFLGGFAVAAWGMRLPLLIAAITVALSNLLFIVMSLHPGELWTFVLAISGDNLAQGFAGTVLVAYMSSLSSRYFTATQYALLSSLANLPGKLIGGVSGFMVESWGYTGFFLFSTLSIVPTLLVMAWLWPRLSRSAPS